MKDHMWYVERRIAHGTYPASEALFSSVEEFVEYLEEEHNDVLRAFNKANERIEKFLTNLK